MSHTSCTMNYELNVNCANIYTENKKKKKVLSIFLTETLFVGVTIFANTSPESVDSRKRMDFEFLLLLLLCPSFSGWLQIDLISVECARRTRSARAWKYASYEIIVHLCNRYKRHHYAVRFCHINLIKLFIRVHHKIYDDQNRLAHCFWSVFVVYAIFSVVVLRSFTGKSTIC